MAEYTLKSLSKSGYHETGEWETRSTAWRKADVTVRSRCQVAGLAGFFNGIKYQGLAVARTEEGTCVTAISGQQFLPTWHPGCLPEPLLQMKSTFHTSLEQR